MRTALVFVATLFSCGTPPSTDTDAGTSCTTKAKSPANLARNAEFECGDAAAEFKSLGTGASVRVTPGRTGNGLTLTTSAGLYGNRFASEWKLIAPAAATYCLTVWLKSTSNATTVRLWGAAPGLAAGQQFDMPGPITTWSKVPPNVKLDVAVKAGDEVSVSLEDKSNTAGTVIELDDVNLWISPDGRCTEPQTAP